MSVCIKLGTLLAQLGQRACPSWARCLPRMGRFAVRRLPNKLMLQHPYSCFQDSANAYNSCRLNSFHLIILFIWQFSFHQQTIQTIGWQLPGSQRSDCQNITIKNQTIWQFFRNSRFYWESAIWETFAHIDQINSTNGLSKDNAKSG